MSFLYENSRVDPSGRETHPLKKVKHQSKPAGTSWDEYPFASSWEGGAASSVVAVPKGQNWKQGGFLSWF